MARVTKDDELILRSVFNKYESTFIGRMKFYRQSRALIKSIKGTTVTFDYPHDANKSEQFSRNQIISAPSYGLCTD